MTRIEIFGKEKEGSKQVGMKYHIYLDILWIEEVVIDWILLHLTGILFRVFQGQVVKRGKKTNWKKILQFEARLCIAANVGAGYTLIAVLFFHWLYVFFGQQVYLVMKLVYAGALILMMGISFEHNGTILNQCKKYCQEICIFQVLIFCLGGLWYWVKAELGDKMVQYAVGVILCTVLFGIFVFWGIRMLNKNKTVCEVELFINDTPIYLQALIDTGNGLKEPNSQKPVSIVEKKMLIERGMEKISKTGISLIPYNTIGKKGVLLALTAKKMVIFENGEKRECQNALIAMYDGILSKNRKYQMLLHPDL